MDDKKYKSIEIRFDEDHNMAETIDYVSMLVNDGYTSGIDPNWELITIDEKPDEDNVITPDLSRIPLVGKLERPDLTKPVFELFPKAKMQVQHTICPLCSNEVNAGPGPTEFRNKLSMNEYRISGICQKCQDKTYGLD